MTRKRFDVEKFKQELTVIRTMTSDIIITENKAGNRIFTIDLGDIPIRRVKILLGKMKAWGQTQKMLADTNDYPPAEVIITKQLR